MFIELYTLKIRSVSPFSNYSTLNIPALGHDGRRRSTATDGVPVVSARDVLSAAETRDTATRDERPARSRAAHADLQVLRGLHPAAGTVAQ